MSAKAPIYLDGATGLVALPGASMTKNAFGIDVLNRPFYAPRSTLASLIPTAGTADIMYSNLKATGNYTVIEEEGKTCKVSVEYKGLLSGTLPSPLFSNGLLSGTASKTNNERAADWIRSVDIVFMSPSQTKRYIADSTVSGATDLPDNTGFTMGAAFPIKIVITDYYGRRATDLHGLSWSTDLQIASFASNPVPGTIYYECEAVFKSILVIAAAASTT